MTKNWSRTRLCAAIFAACLVLQAVPALAAPSTLSAPKAQAGLTYFTQRLAPFGRWTRHPVWGDVWRPSAGPGFRPYFYGYWEYTAEYGWFWVSNEPFGDVVYHYGRWMFDPDQGWLWVPGFIWGPSWVVWRQNDSAIGWLPMPPGYADYSTGQGIQPYAADGWYGYRTFYGPRFVADKFFDLWLFVGNADFGRSDRRRYETRHDELRDQFRRSQERTRYLVDHDQIVDRSIDADRLRREAGRIFDPHPAARFIRRGTPIASVSEGREVALREAELEQRPIAAPKAAVPPGNLAGESANRTTEIRPFDFDRGGIGAQTPAARTPAVGALGGPRSGTQLQSPETPGNPARNRGARIRIAPVDQAGGYRGGTVRAEPFRRGGFDGSARGAGDTFQANPSLDVARPRGVRNTPEISVDAPSARPQVPEIAPAPRMFFRGREQRGRGDAPYTNDITKSPAAPSVPGPDTGTPKVGFRPTNVGRMRSSGLETIEPGPPPAAAPPVQAPSAGQPAAVQSPPPRAQTPSFYHPRSGR